VNPASSNHTIEYKDEPGSEFLIKDETPPGMRIGILFQWPSNMPEIKGKIMKEKINFIYQLYEPGMQQAVTQNGIPVTTVNHMTFFPISISMHEGQEPYMIESKDDFPDESLPCTCGEPGCWFVKYEENYVPEIKTFEPDFVL